MRVLAGLLFTACLFAAAPAHAADRVVVRFSRSADASDRAAARDEVHAVAPRSVPGLTGVQVVTVPEGDAAPAARTLDKSSDVVWAQPAHRMHVTAAMPSATGNQSRAQWGLLNEGQAVYYPFASGYVTGSAGIDGDFTPAWDATTGTGQTIAVVDTGVDFSVRDLAVNEDSARSFLSDDPSPAPAPPDPAPNLANETSHGTHVAGIAAGALGVYSAHDIVGGAPGAHVMSLRALDRDGSGWDDEIAAAFSWAADHGARVVNASLGGGGGESAVLHDAIASHPGTLFVVAAGNDGNDQDAIPADQVDYPCADPSANVICVAAVDSSGQLASFSNYGAATVDLAAPGQDIVSYVKGGTLGYWDGTSMATPFVSAAAALVFASHPCATADQVRTALIDTVRPLSSLAGETVSGGIVDARAAAALDDSASAPRPCASAAPALPAGAPTVGKTIAPTGGFDSGSVSWSWQRCASSSVDSCATIAGASAPTYTPQASDVGKRFRAVATAANGAGTTSAATAVSAATIAVAPPPTPAPQPVAPAPVTPAPTPVATPAPAVSPKLALHKPRRHGRLLSVSGTVTRAFHGTVTIKATHARTVRVRVRNGTFAAKLRPARRGRVTITVQLRAGGGFKAATARRTIKL